MNTYSLSQCEKLISQYLELGGNVVEIEQGSLGLGVVICFAEGYKTAIITEIYLNEWSSAHKVRRYNKTPKKYEAFAS
jgi:hypothetical protein